MASIYERDVSSFPISIATSLALETLFVSRQAPFDPQRKIPAKVEVGKYQTMWFNVWTLWRNLIASVDKSTFLITKVDDLANALEQDMEVIQSLFRIEGLDLCKPIFYFCSYKKLSKIDARIKLREDNTELQKATKAKFLQVVALLMKRVSIVELDSEITTERVNSLIMTHVPYDLLSHKHFNKLDLLESNTGKLKTRHEWSSKYYPVVGSDMSRLPFLKQLLLIFGDKALIHPADTRLRRMILDIAEQRQWTTATTLARVNQCFDLDIRDPYILQFLKSL